MITSKTLKRIDLSSNGVKLKFSANSSIELSFQSIEKIYLKPNKRALVATYLYILFVVLCIVLTMFLQSLFFLIPFILIVLIGTIYFRHKYWINWNLYSNYKLIIVLKNGEYYTKAISQVNKNDTIELINRIKKAI